MVFLWFFQQTTTKAPFPVWPRASREAANLGIPYEAQGSFGNRFGLTNLEDPKLESDKNDIYCG